MIREGGRKPSSIVAASACMAPQSSRQHSRVFLLLEKKKKNNNISVCVCVREREVHYSRHVIHWGMGGRHLFVPPWIENKGHETVVDRFNCLR